MRRYETLLRIYQAAEDWVQGLSKKKILEKYKITEQTLASWRYSDDWKRAVAGRVRQKRESFARYNEFVEAPRIRLAANRWVALGEPSVAEYAEELRVPQKQLEKWMANPFWESCVLYAQNKKARDEKMKGKERKVKSHAAKIRMDLMKQAVFLWLSGWDRTAIGAAIGRNRMTVSSWQQTPEWEAMVEEVMLDKLLMHILDTGMTVREMIQRIMESQWRL